MHNERCVQLGQVVNARYRPSNNKMERLNGEFHDWEQTRRGLKKKPDILLIEGMAAYYNFAKPHSGLGGKTC